MTRTAPRAISLENQKRKGRTRRSDGAGKTRTALLEMRTALPETATTKSTRVYVKNNFVAAKFCSLQNDSWKWTFWERILLFRRIVSCRTTSVANSLRKQRKKFNFLGSQPANRWSRKQFFRINCPIINLWNNLQTVLRRNFFPWKASKNSSWVKSKKTEEENKIRYQFF